MTSIDFQTEKELLDFKAGLLANQQTYYEERIKSLELEQSNIEAMLKRELHKMDLIATGLIFILIAVITSATMIICSHKEDRNFENETHTEVSYTEEAAGLG